MVLGRLPINMAVTLTTVELEKLIANAVKAALSAQVEQEKIDVPLMSGEEVEPERSVALPLSLPAVSEQGVEPEAEKCVALPVSLPTVSEQEVEPEAEKCVALPVSLPVSEQGVEPEAEKYVALPVSLPAVSEQEVEPEAEKCVALPVSLPVSEQEVERAKRSALNLNSLELPPAKKKKLIGVVTPMVTPLVVRREENNEINLFDDSFDELFSPPNRMDEDMFEQDVPAQPFPTSEQDAQVFLPMDLSQILNAAAAEIVSTSTPVQLPRYSPITPVSPQPERPQSSSSVSRRLFPSPTLSTSYESESVASLGDAQGVISDREEVNVSLGDAEADIPVGEVGAASLGVAQADIDVDVSLGDAQGVISDREEVNGVDFYEELFDLDSNDKMNNKDHESIRKSLKTQTFLSKSDRLPSERFAPFMREFSSDMFFLQKATNEAIKEIYKNHNLLFQATVRSAFSKWTGMNFLTPTERKKSNHIQVGNKNFAEKILGSTKLLGANK